MLKRQRLLRRTLENKEKKSNKTNFLLKIKPFISKEGKELNKKAKELQDKEIEFLKMKALHKLNNK